MSAMLPAGFVLQSPIVRHLSLSHTHTHTHSCDEDSGFTHTRLWYTSWQASAIRVVSTTLAMLPVDIFVNVNRIGTFLDSCSHASAAA
jgi:hypothetical protein